jgi:hypothetical protein
LKDEIKVRRGTSEIELELATTRLFEITGSLEDGVPEVRVIAKDGSAFTAGLLLERRQDFDSDDLLPWETSYGYDGVSLLPHRKSTINHQQAWEPNGSQPDLREKPRRPGTSTLRLWI